MITKNLIIAAILTIAMPIGAKADIQCPGSPELSKDQGAIIKELAEKGMATFPNGQTLTLLPNGESDYGGKIVKSKAELEKFLLLGSVGKKGVPDPMQGVSDPTARLLNTKEKKTCPYTISLGTENKVIVLGIK